MIKLIITKESFKEVVNFNNDFSDEKITEEDIVMMKKDLNTFKSKGLKTHFNDDEISIVISSDCVQSYYNMLRPFMKPLVASVKSIVALFESINNAGEKWAEEWLSPIEDEDDK